MRTSAIFLSSSQLDRPPDNNLAMAEEYKLVYLNYRGRAELVRFILAYAGVKYEDSRLDLEKWVELRSGTPLGVLPYLEFDGKTLSGNGTIARYLAEKYGLAGGNALENAELFEIVELCEDIWTRIHAMFWLKDEAVKEQAKKVFKEQFLPPTVAALEKRIARNDCPDGWICGSKVTYADMAVYVLMECLVTQAPSILGTFPWISKLMKGVEKLEAIGAWIQSRPETEH